MNRVSRAVVVTLSLMVFCYVSLGYLLGKTDDDKTYRSLTVYGEVLQHIQEDYVDQPDLAAVSAGSLHGLLESLDPYSAYLSPREYSDYKEKQKNPPRGEVGATVAKRFGYIMVVSVLPDSPAEKAGLRSGDILEAIAGSSRRAPRWRAWHNGEGCRRPPRLHRAAGHGGTPRRAHDAAHPGRQDRRRCVPASPRFRRGLRGRVARQTDAIR